MSKRKRVVLFDAYGTLFKINSDGGQLEKYLKGEKGAFLGMWRSKLLEYSWLTSLSGQWEEFDRIIARALDYTCLSFDINFEEIEPILMEIYTHPSLFEDARDFARKCKAQSITHRSPLA